MTHCCKEEHRTILAGGGTVEDKELHLPVVVQ